MENDRNTIISEYQQTDSNQRLHMFLDCRDLRECFMEIEWNEARNLPIKKASATYKPKILQSLYNRMMAMVPNIFYNV